MANAQGAWGCVSSAWKSLCRSGYSPFHASLGTTLALLDARDVPAPQGFPAHGRPGPPFRSLQPDGAYPWGVQPPREPIQGREVAAAPHAQSMQHGSL